MKTYIAIAGAAVILIGGFFIFSTFVYNEKQSDTTSPELVQTFSELMFEKGTADGLFPIEGFDADLLMSKLPGLVVSDFENVATFEGVYSLKDGELTFERTQGEPISSAERTVSEEGYATLLSNLSLRLNMPIENETDITLLVESVSIDGVVANGEVRAELQTKINGGATKNGVTLTPLRVLEDSRCPIGVQCVWEGTVRVEVSVDHGFGGVSQTFVLGTPVLAEVGVVTLASVEPIPTADTELTESDYVFVFTIK